MGERPLNHPEMVVKPGEQWHTAYDNRATHFCHSVTNRVRTIPKYDLNRYFVLTSKEQVDLLGGFD
jgi:hypothetical protein